MSRIEYVTHNPHNRYAVGPECAAWQDAMRPDIEKQVQALTNEELLQEAMAFSAGDDWEGAITPGGHAVNEAVQEEFTNRLRACGYLEFE